MTLVFPIASLSVKLWISNFDVYIIVFGGSGVYSANDSICSVISEKT